MGDPEISSPRYQSIRLASSTVEEEDEAEELADVAEEEEDDEDDKEDSGLDDDMC